ncbi:MULTISPECIES: copper amine oxidase N-terminal domain-containing protein [unclassified Paenibacillus]|uniref:copper amine oxidase N-terminal domain-containing protein n=1 Tax=unclassified Paenibacillus TaxID=185978 RepID=UPI0009564E67|nr:MULTISPECIES: copper amine oxidase N-terminal domain-containing protein [unclassified Paenibacillus]ASS65788.1 copper amine oxidase N-terminal domain-containing protein [Paenibacillus sp. RUD330]SIQ23699.1 Copper amine oxidase N-terminal domain-containing protein [Paenibacillus sp. RU4X]SIQ45398.1 Copper amine oxidase N-terminal domain-containing protein [Paenibacillus sp. RU4T]
MKAVKAMKAAAAAALIAGAVLPGSGVAEAKAAAPAPLLFIDGQAQPSALSLGGRMLLQLRSLQDPDWLTYSYDAKTRTVRAASKDNSKVIELKEGSRTAIVDGKPVPLDVSIVIRDGKTYVPVRFVSESMGAYVAYDSAKSRTIVRTPNGQRKYDALMGGDLAAARQAAIALKALSLKDPLAAEGEGFSVTYSFPAGEALRYEMVYKQLLSSVVIDADGIAQTVYQRSEIYGQPPKEKGTKPKSIAPGYYFTDNVMAGYMYYGSIDSNGDAKELDAIERASHPEYKNKLIVPIDGEKRTDGK